MAYGLSHLITLLVLVAHPGSDLGVNIPFIFWEAPNTRWKSPVTVGLFLILFVVTAALYYFIAFSDPSGLGYGPLRVNVDCNEYNPHSVYFKNRCKWCGKLMLLRQKHCRKCNVCVRRFDHHCFWTGNCVGLGNHREFFIYLNLQLHYILFCIAEGVRSLTFYPHSIFSLAIVPVMVVQVYFGAFILMLIRYHISHLTKNLTTFEYVRGCLYPPYAGRFKANPLKNRGWLKNLLGFFIFTNHLEGALVVSGDARKKKPPTMTFY